MSGLTEPRSRTEARSRLSCTEPRSRTEARYRTRPRPWPRPGPVPDPASALGLSLVLYLVDRELILDSSPDLDSSSIIGPMGQTWGLPLVNVLD